MSTSRTGCTHCFVILDPSDPREDRRDFVCCQQCGALYHDICWQRQPNCVAPYCDSTSAEPVTVPLPPPLEMIYTRAEAFYPTEIVYLIGSRIYTRGQLLLYSSLGIVTIVAALSLTTAIVTVGRLWLNSAPLSYVNTTSTAVSISEPATKAAPEPTNIQISTPTLILSTPIPMMAVPADQNGLLNQANQWSTYYSDGFESDRGVWYTGDYRTRDGSKSGILSISDNMHHWQISFSQPGTWWVRPTIKPVADFYLSTEMKHSGGAGDTSYGLIFRLQEEKPGNGIWSYYRFRINDSQKYEFSLIDKGNEATLIDWKVSAAILPDDTNRLTVITQGSHFTLYVNDQFVDEVTDNRLDKGQVGLIVALSQAGDALFLSDDFLVRIP